MQDSFQPDDDSFVEDSFEPDAITVTSESKAPAQDQGLVSGFLQEHPSIRQFTQRLLTGFSDEDKQNLSNQGVTGILGPPSDNSILPKLEHPTNEGWPGYLARGAYNTLIQPLGSPEGFLGAAQPKEFIGPVDNPFPAARDLTGLESELAGLAKGEIKPPSLAMPEALPEIKSPIAPSTPQHQQKLLDSLGKSRLLNTNQREINAIEHAEKAAKAGSVNVQSEADLGKFFGALKGEHAKVSINPLRNDLAQTDIDSLIKDINDAPGVTTYEKANAYEGLQKLLDGKVPTDYDVTIMERIYGPDFASKARRLTLTTGRKITEGMSVFKSLMSGLDFGIPFRQGINYAGQKEWRDMLLPMAKGYFSQGAYDTGMEAIRADPLFELMQKSKLALTDLKGLTNREEFAMSTWAEKLPHVKASNRAFTLGINKLRTDVFKSLYRDYKNLYESSLKTVTDAAGIKDLQRLNPDNPYVASRIADEINVATGRGKLPGRLEKIAPELNATLFSPRLMSARMRSINRVLNPVSYASYDPIQRREALKQLLSIAGTGVTTATLFKLVPNSEVSLAPNSSDFGKIKVGNMRLDPWGGYQQYFTPVAKVLTNSAVSTKTGNEYQLGSNPVVQNAFDVLLNSGLNKFAPIPSLAVAILKGHEQNGQKTNLTGLSMDNAIISRTIPMLIGDLTDVANENPYLIPAVLPFAASGMGTQVYEK